MSQDQQQHLKKGGGTNYKQSSFQIPQDGKLNYLISHTLFQGVCNRGSNQRLKFFQLVLLPPQVILSLTNIANTLLNQFKQLSIFIDAWENFPPNLFTQLHSKTAQKKTEKPSPLSLLEQMTAAEEHQTKTAEQQPQPRKGSIVDYCDDEECEEEIKNMEEEKGTRFSVNQKLIKKYDFKVSMFHLYSKNQFQDYSQIKGRTATQQNDNMPVKNQRYIG